MRRSTVSIITVKFIGSDSLGYKHGEIYKLTTFISEHYILIERQDGSGVCPYSNVKAFLSNWEIIR